MKVDIHSAKKWLRQSLIIRRRSISASSRRLLSRKIARKVIQSSRFKKAKTIAVFLSFGSEVQTDLIIQAAWKGGKTVLIPDTHLGFQKPYFSIFNPGDNLRKTKYGPMELKTPRPPFPTSKIDLVYVPGLGFDKRGFRLGFGAGVYDRLLQSIPPQKCFGLFYSCQNLHRIPHVTADHRMGDFLTEK